MAFHKNFLFLHNDVIPYGLLKLQAHISTDFNSNQPKSIYLRYTTIYYTLSAKTVDGVSIHFVKFVSSQVVLFAHVHALWDTLQSRTCDFGGCMPFLSISSVRFQQSNPSSEGMLFRNYVEPMALLSSWELPTLSVQELFFGLVDARLHSAPALSFSATHCEDFGWSHWRGHKIWTLTCPTIEVKPGPHSNSKGSTPVPKERFVWYCPAFPLLS